MSAVVPGPLGEPGVGRQLRHWTSPRRLLQTLRGGGVGLCQPAVGVGGGSRGRALFLRAGGRDGTVFLTSQFPAAP